MHPALYLKLHTAIETFVEKSYEDDNWPTCWVAAGLVESMAKSAALVFDAATEAAHYAAEQEQESFPHD